jgi:hypothetical protein
MQCHALRKNAHPCRNYAVSYDEHPHHLCWMHRNFFQTPEPAFKLMEANASIFQTTKERDWIVRMLKAYNARCRTETESTAIATDFKERLEALFDEGTWYDRDKAEYIYTICLLSGILKPLDLKSIWIRGVFRQLRVLQFCCRENEVPPYYGILIRQLLLPYFEGADPEMVLPTIFKIMKKTTREVTNQHNVVDISGQMWSEVFTTVVGVMDHTPIAFRETGAFVKPMIEDHTPPFMELVEDLLIQLFSEKKDQIREKIKEHISLFKEELIQQRWHPSRIKAALDAGMEIEDL